MRGRLIFPLYADLARVDRDAMVLGAPDVDPDFREPRILAAEPDDVGERARRELPPVRVPCQVEPDSFEALSMVGAGNEPQSRVQLVLHFRDLEERRLVDPANLGAAIL
ncbi:MAG: hypothetical protein ACLQBL_09395, partial [Polyangiaceae bacterium]